MKKALKENQNTMEAKSLKYTAGSYIHLRLHSINMTSKILGIRHQQVKKLISDGKLNAVEINGKCKVPLAAIEDFIKNKSAQADQRKTDRGPVPNYEERIKKIIKKHS